MLIFRKKSVQWSQTPSPLAYSLYAFINVDNCERPLKEANNKWRNKNDKVARTVNTVTQLGTPVQRRKRRYKTGDKRWWCTAWNETRVLYHLDEPAVFCYDPPNQN